MNIRETKPTPVVGGVDTPKEPIANEPQTLMLASDELNVSSLANPETQKRNPLASSPGRRVVDVMAGVAGAADGARGIAPTARAIRIGSQAGGLGRWGALGLATAKRMERAVAVWGRFSQAAPGVANFAANLARCAPFLGVGVAALDVGRAIIEDNPDKQHEATGVAALSVTASLAGLVGAGAAAGLTIAGFALASVAVPATVIGLSATAVVVIDQFLLRGALTRPIGKSLARIKKLF
jgi:hypothetical protein